MRFAIVLDPGEGSMGDKSPISASDEQRVALATLAGSRDRGEADRARAVLLTLSGWTSPRIAEAFGVREDTVRLWRSDFDKGGVEALKVSVAPGPAPLKSLWPTGRTGRSRVFAPKSKRARASASAGRNCPRRCEKKVPLPAAPAHAERAADRQRGRADRPASAIAQASGRSRRHHAALWR